MTNASLAPDPVPPAPHRRGALSTKTLLIALAAAAVLIFLAVGLYLAARPPPPQIQGMVEAETFTVATKTISRVEKMLVSEGDPVTAGQVLAILSSPEVKAGDEKAAAALRSAEALQELTRAGARVEDIRSAESVWRSAEAAANLAAKTARRAETLYAEGVISTQRRDEAVAARTASAAQANAARQQYLKIAAGARSEEKTIADAQVASARAGVGEMESLEAETRLVSPAPGEVAERFSNPGELVLIGVPVLTVVDLSRVWVSFNLRESEFHDLSTGQTLRGDIPALNLKNVPFRVNYISPEGDFAIWRATRQSRGYDVRSFEIHAKPVSPVKNLRPGMSVLFHWPAR